MMAGVVARASAAISQVVLGGFLTQAQFGIYGTGIGIQGVTGFMRAGGSGTYLPSLTPDEFRRESGRLFGWALLCTVTGVALTSAAAAPVARLYNEPQLAWVLYLLAARNALAVVSVQARMRMAVDHRFKELAIFDACNSAIKLALVCVLAWWLSGSEYAVLALAVPYAAASLAELVYCVPASGITWSELTPRANALWRTARELRWSFALATLISINSQTNFAVISRLPAIPVDVVGVVYFAFQMASQPMVLLTGALQNVFAPIMARERGDPTGEQQTLRQIFTGAMLFAPFFIFFACALFPSAEALVYGDRWEAAISPFFFWSLGVCFATVNGLLNGPLLGLRKFKTLAGFEAVRAMGFIGGTVAGYAFWRIAPTEGLLAGPATLISAGAGLGMAIVAACQMAHIMSRNGMRARDIAKSLVHGPTLALLSMVASISVGDSIVDSFGRGFFAPSVANGLRLLVTGLVFMLLTIACLRSVAEGTMRSTMSVLPPRIAGFLRRALLMQ